MTVQNEMSVMVTDALSRLLKDNWEDLQNEASTVDADGLWSQINESGFLDVLIPEDNGGAGLSMEDAYTVLRLSGYYALTLPLVTTAMAKHWLQNIGEDYDYSSITLANAFVNDDGVICSNNIPFHDTAEYALCHINDESAVLTKVEELINGSATMQSSKVINFKGKQQISVELLIASCFSILLAGAADRVLEITVEYAHQRTQFGRSIGKFQAVQGQISSMAERVCAMRMAGRMVAGSDYSNINVLAATAKSVCSEAANQVARTSHAVHGAMGVTQEYILQRFTRLMHEWRRVGGAESYWSNKLGHIVLASSHGSALDFILHETNCTRLTNY